MEKRIITISREFGHEMVEGFIFLTFCIQPVKSTFHVVIL